MNGNHSIVPWMRSIPCQYIDKVPYGCVQDRVRFTYQALGERRLVPIGQMLFQSQNDTVGNDGSENHPLKWSEGCQSRKYTKQHGTNSNIKTENALHFQHVNKSYCNCSVVVFSYTRSAFKVIKLINESTLSGYGSPGIFTTINSKSLHKSNKKPNPKPKVSSQPRLGS